MYRYGNTVRWLDGPSRLDEQIREALLRESQPKVMEPLRDTSEPIPDLRTWWDIYQWNLSQGAKKDEEK